MGSKKASTGTTPFSGQPTPGVIAAPNAFEQFQKAMPQEYFGNAPIHDPSAILNAYMQNMPRFLTVRPPAPETAAKPVAKKKSSSAMDTLKYGGFAPAKLFKKLF